ncbi:hypothetical protein [Halovivax sp.]|uniref:hypothetical protein n=1 Tax=Halovivax sp. TaxID=1935978 RepID=UPI0025C397B9|nr:hypothetical protein [Halovivax sp.]
MRVLTAIFAVLWLPLAITGANPLEMLGGGEVAVMVATLVAPVGVYDMAVMAGLACYGGS